MRLGTLPKLAGLGRARSGGAGVTYLLRDEFTTDAAAGSLNGTLATDGVNLRTAVDTGSKLSISGGALVWGGMTVSGADPNLYYPAMNRIAGRMLGFAGISTPDNLVHYSGWGAKGIGNRLTWNLYQNTSLFVTIASNNKLVAAVVAGTYYLYAIVLRSTGAHWFIKGGVFTNWTLLWVDSADASADFYPRLIVGNSNGTRNFDYIRIPDDLWLPSPIVSDGFSAAAADGKGHAEGIAGGIGEGGGGGAWTSALGTWGVAAGVCSSSVLGAGNISRRIITGVAGCILDAKVIRAGGNAGIILRYTDANNFVYAYLLNDGADKVTLRKVVAGTDSEVLAPTAITYAAGAVLRVLAVGTSFRVFYNGNAVGAGQTIADAALQSATGTGMYTTDTGNTFDDFLCWPTGAEGQHAALNSFFSCTIPSINALYFGDSKTTGTGVGLYSDYLNTLSILFYEIPTRIAAGGTTVSSWVTNLSASLAAAVGTPAVILANLGANDFVANSIDSEQWLADYLTLCDKFHAKWPYAQIYIMRPWTRNGPDACDGGALVIDQMVAERSFVHLGPDERDFLENGDDGMTYTIDGVHPNNAGVQLTALQWRTVLGY